MKADYWQNLFGSNCFGLSSMMGELCRQWLQLLFLELKYLCSVVGLLLVRTAHSNVKHPQTFDPSVTTRLEHAVWLFWSNGYNFSDCWKWNINPFHIFDPQSLPKHLSDSIRSSLNKWWENISLVYNVLPEKGVCFKFSKALKDLIDSMPLALRPCDQRKVDLNLWSWSFLKI